MSSRLIDSLATTEALARASSDRAVVEALIAFERALASVEARLGLIPPSAADAVARAAVVERFDVDAISVAARQSGTIALPFVNALTDLVREIDPASAGYVHWGATSQDAVDTAIVLMMTRMQAIIADDHRRLAAALFELSERHAATVMVGRTLLQPALPTTFGLKVAGWYAAVARSWADVTRAASEALVPQLGGAVGTLAAFGEQGTAVADAFAHELGLPAAAPWHVHRDRLAAFAAAHGVYVGALGKIARDIALLMQTEVGEASEPGGASSTMPQKRNPAGSAIVLAAATRVPGLVATLLSSMVQEHERAVGGWHAEWPALSDLVQASGSAASALADVVTGLEVSVEAMRRHLDAAQGAIVSERVALRLAPIVGRARAHAIVRDAVAASRAEGRALSDVLAALPDVTRVISPEDIRAVDGPDTYLGVADALRRRLLAGPSPRPV